MKIDRVVVSERFEVALAGKAGITGQGALLCADGSVMVGDVYLYRPPEVIAQRATDRARFKLRDDPPNYASRQELSEIADFCIAQWQEFKAKL